MGRVCVFCLVVAVLGLGSSSCPSVTLLLCCSCLGKLRRGERQGQESVLGSCPNLGSDSMGNPKGQILPSEVYLVFHFPSLLVTVHTASLMLSCLSKVWLRAKLLSHVSVLGSLVPFITEWQSDQW